jgi:hypothetical protein
MFFSNNTWNRDVVLLSGILERIDDVSGIDDDAPSAVFVVFGHRADVAISQANFKGRTPITNGAIAEFWSENIK